MIILFISNFTILNAICHIILIKPLLMFYSTYYLINICSTAITSIEDLTTYRLPVLVNATIKPSFALLPILQIDKSRHLFLLLISLVKHNLGTTSIKVGIILLSIKISTNVQSIPYLLKLPILFWPGYIY